MDRAKFKETMAEIIKQPVARLGDDVLLSNLVTDSFLLVDMVIELQEEFAVFLVQEDLKTVKSVGDLIELFDAKSRETA
jgi:acyl carrier protein